MKKQANRNEPVNSTEERLCLSVRLRDDVTMERPGNGRIILSKNGRKRLDVPDITLIDRLSESGMTEASVDQMAEASASPSAVYFVCEQLFSFGLLEARCVLDGRPLFSLLPSPGWDAWRGSMPASLRLSPLACLRRAGDHFTLEMPLSQRKCTIDDEHCLVWLMETSRGDLSFPIKDTARGLFYRMLWLMNALIGDESAREAMWEFHDLLFFHHSSIGFHDDPIGATWPLKDTLPPEPPFKPCTGECISLPEPDEELTARLRSPFEDVLSRRRSRRTAGNRPITLEELGALLHTSAHVQEIVNEPDLSCVRSLRPSPSGGGLHSLEIYPLVHRCADLSAGAWRYDPFQNRLESIPVNHELLHAYLNSNPHPRTQSAFLPHIRLVITSRFLRDSWKYQKIAYRLVLQDLGCLYQTLSLTATALGLSSCILGAVDARRLGVILGLNVLAEPVIGEMTLSSS